MKSDPLKNQEISSDSEIQLEPILIMANEFEKRLEDGENVWTCNFCAKEIRSRTKPRDHVCQEHENTNENHVEISTSETYATHTGVTTTSTPTTTSNTPLREAPQRTSISAPTTPFPAPPVFGQQFGNQSIGARMTFPPDYQNLQSQQPPTNMNDAASALQWQTINLEK